MSDTIVIRQMMFSDIPAVVGLQRICFPPPFPEENHWTENHISKHVEIFPDGQYVAIDSAKNTVVGSASACRISEQNWQAHKGWEETLGGYLFNNYDSIGTTLYGADISVHPGYRKNGIGKKLYLARFELVATLHLVRYGTACRIPDYAATHALYSDLSLIEYCEQVVLGIHNDRTLSPLLRMGLTFIDVIENYMEDKESFNAAALLEWKPQ